MNKAQKKKNIAFSVLFLILPVLLFLVFSIPMKPVTTQYSSEVVWMNLMTNTCSQFIWCIYTTLALMVANVFFNGLVLIYPKKTETLFRISMILFLAFLLFCILSFILGYGVSTVPQLRE